jgi:hypothetical protein
MVSSHQTKENTMVTKFYDDQWRPLTKAAVSSQGMPSGESERDELLRKAANASDPYLAKGYRERAYALADAPVVTPDLSAAAQEASHALLTKAATTTSRELATGYRDRAADLRKWFRGGEA